MIGQLVLLAAISIADAPATSVRPLSANSTVHESIAGGEKAVYSIDVPPQSAARIVVEQQGVDVDLKLRRLPGDEIADRSEVTAALTGTEQMLAPISDTPATWTVVVEPALPHATRGDYTISLEVTPAGDHERAIDAARRTFNIADTTSRLGDGKGFGQAVIAYAKAADDALAAGDKSLAAEATYQLARVHDNLGDIPKAIEVQHRALALFEEIGRRDRQARVLNRLGDLSRKVGEVGDSERFFAQALPIAREANDPAAVADILNNSGLLMSLQGRWEDALAQLEAAVPLAHEIDSANVEAALWHNIGDAYARLGVPSKAIDAYKQAINLSRTKLPVRRTARELNSLATIYFNTGEQSKAEEAVRDMLDLWEKAQDRAGIAQSQLLVGRMQHAGGDDTAAIESFSRALPVLRELHDRNNEGSLLTTWAEVDVDRGDANAALQRIDEALALFRATAFRSAEASALYVRALALQKNGAVEDAIAAISGAIDIVETMRGAIVRTELRTSYLTTVHRYYDLYIELLLSGGGHAPSPVHVAAAFEVSERARARSLLESLAESAAKISKGIDPELLKRLRAVQAELNAKEAYRAQVALRDGEKSSRAMAVRKDVDRLLDTLKEIQAKVRKSSPAYSALKMPEPVSAARVQQTLLDANTALIEYHLGRTRSYAWVIDHARITVHKLPPESAIDDLSRRYQELLSGDVDALTNIARLRREKEIAAAGARMTAAVWKPVSQRVKGKRVLIVADGALQYVPFAALPAPGSGEPLIVAHEIVYLPSASVLETIRRGSRRIARDARVAVFADPVFSRNDSRLGAEVLQMGARERGDAARYQRLRFSRKEAEAIVATAAPRNAFEALDFSAAKDTLAGKDLRRYSILHFATHGSLNTEQPELSGLVLSLVDKSGKPVDGFLRLHEIYNLDLDADLVVLSACRTALGKEVHGEGLIGLTRGFMYAGASRVVSSIWNVDDRASAMLISRFYRAMLTDRMPPAAALREAQLSLLRQPRWSDPHYWAAFGLQGEWR